MIDQQNQSDLDKVEASGSKRISQIFSKRAMHLYSDCILSVLVLLKGESLPQYKVFLALSILILFL